MSAPSDPVAAPVTEPAAPVVNSEPSAPETAPETVHPPKVDPSEASPLSTFFAELPSIIAETGHREMWGVELTNEGHVPSSIVLEKFLRANGKDVEKAKAQLTEAMKWRKNMDPAKLLKETEFDSPKFGNLGFVTVYGNKEGGKEIVTWNIYGGVKDIKSTFGNVEEFIKWRAALMELSVQQLNLAAATEKIPADGLDSYRMVQVHDYLNTSFLRAPPEVKVASKQTIQVFSMAYPELLKEKFFVNVPLVMGWFFTAMKLFLSPETVKKFHPLSYGSNLAGELPGFGEELPPAYGGKGKEIKDGLTVKYASSVEAPAVDAAEVK